MQDVYFTYWARSNLIRSRQCPNQETPQAIISLPDFCQLLFVQNLVNLMRMRIIDHFDRGDGAER